MTKQRMYQFECGCQWPIVGPAPREGALPLLDVDDDHLPDCPAVWDMLGKGLTKGVFQLESSLGKSWTKKLKPTSVEHLCALGALLRPGCLHAKDTQGISMTEHYVRRKNGVEEVVAYCPQLEPILAKTYQVIAYQEQLMRMGKELAGFDLVAVDKLRKAVGKKDVQELSSVKRMFLEGCEKTGVVTSEQATTIWDWMEKSGRYLFNRCVTSETIIRRPNGGKPLPGGHQVGRMYRIRNDIEFAKQHGHFSLYKKWKRLGHYGYGLSVCEDGRIRPNIIRDIQPSGTQSVFKVVLTDGRFVRATATHKFPTPNGEKTLVELQIGDFLQVCGQYEPSNSADISRFSDMTRERLKQHNAGDSGKSVNKQFGKANWAYTNGSYTEFKKNKKLLPNKCAECKRSGIRLETHHKNKDRTNSSIDNLEKLCASCHKKKDYKLGRTRKNQKGFPVELVAIRDILPDGEEQTYDVTMDGPNHNFVVGQDIVVCNSHSMSYGLLGYDTAYMKAHFPPAFFANWLYYAKEKAEPLVEIAELVQEAKLFDVAVEPPDLRDLEPHFVTDGVNVRFGLADVKGIGDIQVQKLKTAVAETATTLGRPLTEWSWFEFLAFCAKRVTSTVITRLIEVGAFRWLGLPRKRLLAEWESWQELTPTECEWLTDATLLAAGKYDLAELERQSNAELVEQEGEDEETKKERFRQLRQQKTAAKRLLKLAEQELPPFHAVLPALRLLGRPRKEGGGVATAARLAVVESLVSLLDKPPSPLVDTPNWVAWVEEQYLGVALSCTRVDACDISQANCSCKDLVAGRAGFLAVAVEVKNVRVVKTKQGKNPGQKMAFLTIADSSCAVDDVTVFPNAFKEYGKLLTVGNTVLVEGERDPKQGSFLVNHVYQL